MANQGAPPSNGDPDFETQFDVEERPPWLATVRAVAILKDVDLEEIEPLYESIDPEILDKLFQSSHAEIVVQFEFEGYKVELESEGRVRLYEMNSTAGR